jgi:hypothetical protein
MKTLVLLSSLLITLNALASQEDNSGNHYGQVKNSGQIYPVPDRGGSLLLMALGLSPILLLARKRA